MHLDLKAEMTRYSDITAEALTSQLMGPNGEFISPEVMMTSSLGILEHDLRQRHEDQRTGRWATVEDVRFCERK